MKLIVCTISLLGFMSLSWAEDTVAGSCQASVENAISICEKNEQMVNNMKQEDGLQGVSGGSGAQMENLNHNLKMCHKKYRKLAQGCSGSMKKCVHDCNAVNDSGGADRCRNLAPQQERIQGAAKLCRKTAKKSKKALERMGHRNPERRFRRQQNRDCSTIVQCSADNVPMTDDNGQVMFKDGVTDQMKFDHPRVDVNGAYVPPGRDYYASIDAGGTQAAGTNSIPGTSSSGLNNPYKPEGGSFKEVDYGESKDLMEKGLSQQVRAQSIPPSLSGTPEGELNSQNNRLENLNRATNPTQTNNSAQPEQATNKETSPKPENEAPTIEEGSSRDTGSKLANGKSDLPDLDLPSGNGVTPAAGNSYFPPELQQRDRVAGIERTAAPAAQNAKTYAPLDGFNDKLVDPVIKNGRIVQSKSKGKGERGSKLTPDSFGTFKSGTGTSATGSAKIAMVKKGTFNKLKGKGLRGEYGTFAGKQSRSARYRGGVGSKNEKGHLGKAENYDKLYKDMKRGARRVASENTGFTPIQKFIFAEISHHYNNFEDDSDIDRGSAGLPTQ